MLYAQAQVARFDKMVVQRRVRRAVNADARVRRILSTTTL